MNETSNRPELWTAWCDYFATGEGRSIMAYITYASSAEQMKAHFSEKFGEWSAKGCEVQMGVVRNAFTQLLWTEVMLKWIEECGRRRGRVDAYTSMHFNFS